MRIAILTSGRFWACDLARELDALGHDVSFYSLVPPWRTRRFGLPDRCNRWLAPYVTPFYALASAARGTSLESRANSWLTIALDKAASIFIRQCDLFIGLSGMCLHTIETVKRKYGAKVFIERGSRHILSQREILESLPRRPGASPPVPQWAVDRELAEYDLADTIVVPSSHVVRSFVERGFDEARIFRNPYGVDLKMFPPTEAPSSEAPSQIIMTGIWSLQKGCDLLIDAWRSLPGVKLLHIGAVGDAPLPADQAFEHHPPVDQSQLNSFYSRGHVFALASRQEGLALVQAQALASGLHLVCTDHTGGEDLREFLENPEIISVVPSGDSRALMEALGRALESARSASGFRDHLGPAREMLSWRAYGERYNRELSDRV
ncbi:MAG: glycosyltransferase family 4 protein [Pyrinomonadaceae bacterium]